ncbi:DLW-39 family protein [Cumulibacter manganitolerans]|nr:DLW-39 family protein [Cumulibacter manganitolerans]
MRKLLLVILGALGFALAKRRREADRDAALWREATSGSGTK